MSPRVSTEVLLSNMTYFIQANATTFGTCMLVLIGRKETKTLRAVPMILGEWHLLPNLIRKIGLTFRLKGIEENYREIAN